MKDEAGSLEAEPDVIFFRRRERLDSALDDITTLIPVPLLGGPDGAVLGGVLGPIAASMLLLAVSRLRIG
jgi:hypothetical protein